jgi:photosystem II stability/assembly factor-like uncharacterized protein
MTSVNLKLFIIGLVLLLALSACGPLTSRVPLTTAPAVANTSAPATEPPTSPPATSTPTIIPTTPPPAGTTPPVRGQLSTVSSPSIQTLDMLDASNGWALNETSVLRTQDGGQTWLDATPARLNGQLTGSFFLDDQTGWVLLAGSDFISGTLFHTADGGESWTPSAVPFGGGSLQFLDAQNGWALVGLGAAMSHEAVAVYRTSDAGATWSQVFTDDPNAPDAGDTLPFVGDKNGLTALDADHAWVTGSEPVSNYVYVFTTQDGGRTWRKQNPALPAGYADAMTGAYPPHFFNAKDGVMQVGAYADNPALILYLSHDGGQTWTAATPVPLNAHASTPSLSDFFAWDGGSAIYVSHDAGASWSTVTPNVILTNQLVTFQFIDATTGWAVTSDANGHYKLYRTMDGGSTWNMLIP